MTDTTFWVVAFFLWLPTVAVMGYAWDAITRRWRR